MVGCGPSAKVLQIAVGEIIKRTRDRGIGGIIDGRQKRALIVLSLNTLEYELCEIRIKYIRRYMLLKIIRVVGTTVSRGIQMLEKQGFAEPEIFFVRV